MAPNTVPRVWWRDPRSDFDELATDSTRLQEREDMRPAIVFVCTELVPPVGPRILDLCCGAGRYAVELAHRGYDVMGLDINEDYIALAHQLAERERDQALFLRGDMRKIPFERHFDAVTNVGTSYGFFDCEGKNRCVVQAVAKALKPKGSFLLEMGNRDYYPKNFRTKDWRRLENDQVVVDSQRFDYVRSRINATFEVVGGKRVERWTHSWRAYTLAEMAAMMEQEDLALSCAYGSWQRREYSVDSPRMVIVAKNKG